MIHRPQIFAGHREGEHRLLCMSAEIPARSDEIKPVVKPEAKKETASDTPLGLTDYVSSIAQDGRDAIRERMEMYLGDDGKILNHEVAQINTLIKQALLSVQSLGNRTLDQFNELIAGLPQTGEELVSFAKRIGLFTEDEIYNIYYRAGQKNTSSTPGATAPGVPSNPYRMPGNTAYVPSYGEQAQEGVEIPKEVAEAQLLAGLEGAKRDIDMLGRERSRLLRQFKADKRRGMTPSDRRHYYSAITEEVRARRDQLGDPIKRYWEIRNQWEASSGISYSYYLGQQKGNMLLPPPPSKESARLISIVDGATGKTLGSYDEWTGSGGGKMPKEEILRIIQSHPNVSGYGKVAKIVVDGSRYLAPRPTFNDRHPIPYNVSLREQQNRKFLTAKSPYSEKFNSWRNPYGDMYSATLSRADMYQPVSLNTGSSAMHLDNPRIEFASTVPSVAPPWESAPIRTRGYESFGRMTPWQDAAVEQGLRRLEDAGRASFEASSSSEQFGSYEQYLEFSSLIGAWKLKSSDERTGIFRYRFDDDKNMEAWKQQSNGTWLYAKIDKDGYADRVKTMRALPESILRPSEIDEVAKVEKVTESETEDSKASTEKKVSETVTTPMSPEPAAPKSAPTIESSTKEKTTTEPISVAPEIDNAKEIFGTPTESIDEKEPDTPPVESAPVSGDTSAKKLTDETEEAKKIFE